jgi:outer membrane protein insertion porin family
VEEGIQYRLKDIRFQKDQAIRDFGTWRGMFKIKDGDIFNREKIDTGLESLRKAYAELGYMNFTGLAGFQLYDEHELISVLIDVDEGKQFRVQEIRVLGLEDSARENLLKSMSIHRGQIFNGKTWEDSVLKYAPPLPDCPCRQQKSMDERAGLVTLTLDFRPCSAE